MQAAIIIESTQSKIDLLVSIAQHIGISVVSMHHEKIAINELTVISASSLSEAWDSEEDNRWDDLYRV